MPFLFFFFPSLSQFGLQIKFYHSGTFNRALFSVPEIFKTVIWVSCFSKRCYQQAQLIMSELRATRQKVNGNLFEGYCGLTDEPALYGLLCRMAQGQLSKEEFAKEGAREKVCFVFFQPRHNKVLSASSVLG